MANLASYLANAWAVPEDTIRLLLSLVAGFPLAVVYKIAFQGKSPTSQHVYFTVCGLCIGYFNFGLDVMHYIANIVLIFLLLLLLGATTLSVSLAFVLNLAYLYIGYYYNMRDVYMIDWSMAHCVLTLRLTGLVFDVYDGKKKQDELSAEQKISALETTPSLLEMCGHVFFFGGFLVGPQFPMKKYLDFTHSRGIFSDHVTRELGACLRPALLRLAAGLIYATLHQKATVYFPETYVATDEFKMLAFWKKLAMLLVYSRVPMYKYILCWLVTESACIMSGLGYNGKDEHGRHLWNGCTNISIWKFEMTTLGQTYVTTFNLNTNRWLGQYVFKRFKFLGNRNASQVIALVYLALWHGFYSGYLVAFLLEFLVINAERLLGPVLATSWPVKTLHAIPGGPWLTFCLQKLWGHLSVGYAFIAFSLLTYDRYLDVYLSMYFFMHVATIGAAVMFALLRPGRSKQDQAERVKQQ